MYVAVGQVTGDLDAVIKVAVQGPIVWNPPGWGSFASLDRLRRFARWIPGDWRLAMVLALKPGSFIPFHRDDPATENALDGVALTRYHLVVATHPHCWSFHAGTWQQLTEGGLYTMDPTQEHASINLGPSIRYHLVVDVATQKVCDPA